MFSSVHCSNSRENVEGADELEEKRRSLSLSSDVGLYSQSGDQEGGPEGDGVGSDRKWGGLETYSAAVLTGPFSPGKRSCSGRALPSEAPFKNKRGLLAAFQNNPDSSVGGEHRLASTQQGDAGRAEGRNVFS